MSGIKSLLIWMSVLALTAGCSSVSKQANTPATSPEFLQKKTKVAEMVLSADAWRSLHDLNSQEAESMQVYYVRGFVDALAYSKWLKTVSEAESAEVDLPSSGPMGLDVQELVKIINKSYADYPQFGSHSPAFVLGSALIEFAASPDKGLPSPEEFVPYDKPPVPISQAEINYPPLAKEAGIEGTVWVKVLIDKNGNVKDAEIHQSSGTNVGLEEEALRAAFKNRYKPAMLHDRPVAVWVVYPVRFSL